MIKGDKALLSDLPSDRWGAVLSLRLIKPYIKESSIKSTLVIVITSSIGFNA